MTREREELTNMPTSPSQVDPFYESARHLSHKIKLISPSGTMWQDVLNYMLSEGNEYNAAMIALNACNTSSGMRGPLHCIALVTKCCCSTEW